MQIYNCTSEVVRIFDHECLELDYDDWTFLDYWVLRDDVLRMIVLSANVSLIPTIINQQEHDLIKQIRYDKLPLPPYGYDYYIVTNLQMILYTKQRVDVSRMVLLGDIVLGDCFETIGYKTLISMRFD